jgi:hypothetical protein
MKKYAVHYVWINLRAGDRYGDRAINVYDDAVNGLAAATPVGVWAEDGSSVYLDDFIPSAETRAAFELSLIELGLDAWVEQQDAKHGTWSDGWAVRVSEDTAESLLESLHMAFLAKHPPVDEPDDLVQLTSENLDREDSEGAIEGVDGAKEDSDAGESDDAAFTPAQRYVIAQSWWVASELARRHPDLVIHEMHPGGGMYDCLALLSPGDLQPFIQLNRVGTIHVTSVPEYRTTWAEALEAASPHAVVKEIEQVAGLSLPAKAPASTPRTLAYRFIATTLNATSNDRHKWDARNEFIDSSDDIPTVLNGYLAGFPEVRRSLLATPQIGLWHEPESHYWALLRDETPVAIVSIEGIVYRPDRQIDLAAEYRRHAARMLPVLASALADVLP